MSAPKQLMPKESDISVDAHSSAADAHFVADYIDQGGPAIHSAFGEPSQFDKQRAIYRSSPWHQYVIQISPSRASYSGFRV